MDYHSVGEHYFTWVVENMSRLVIERALHGYTPGSIYRWDAMLNSTPGPAGAKDSKVGPSQPKVTKTALVDPSTISWAWNGFKIPGGSGSKPAGAGGHHEPAP